MTWGRAFQAEEGAGMKMARGLKTKCIKLSVPGIEGERSE